MNPNENNSPEQTGQTQPQAPANLPAQNIQPPSAELNTQPSGSPNTQGPGKFNFLKGRNSKLAAIIIAAIIIIGGGGVAAYYAVTVPNKPQNVLKSSFKNLLEKDQVSGKGHAVFKSTDSGSFKGTTTLDYTLQTDKTKNAFDSQLDFSYSGVKVPLELRGVDKSIYLKLGDLSTLSSLLSGLDSLGAQGSSSIAKQLSSKLSNKWIEFDQSLIGTATQDKCSALTDQKSLSEDQINQLLDIYDQNTFVVVNDTSSDNVNGKAVTKYQLDLDKTKAEEFTKQLGQIDYIKKLEQCGNSSSQAGKTEADFTGTSTATVWIDKSKKELVKVQVTAKDSKTSTDLDFTFDDNPVNITKPEGAVPAMQIYNEIISTLSGSINFSSSQLPDSSSGNLFQ